MQRRRKTRARIKKGIWDDDLGSWGSSIIPNIILSKRKVAT